MNDMDIAQKFLENRDFCPRCVNANITPEPVEVAPNYDSVWIDIGCNDCEFEITVVYELEKMEYFDGEEEHITEQSKCPRCSSVMFWDYAGEGDDKKQRLDVGCDDCGLKWMLHYDFSMVVPSEEFYKSEE